MCAADAWTGADRLLADLLGPGQSSTAHRITHDHLLGFARDVLSCIADIAEDVGEQAGVGGMETAGQLVSFIADHPEHLEALLARGIFELPTDWIERGSLTWRAANGKLVHPAHARRARIIGKLKRGEPV